MGGGLTRISRASLTFRARASSMAPSGDTWLLRRSKEQQQQEEEHTTHNRPSTQPDDSKPA